MFSIVVVYNNEQALNKILLQSLKNQTVQFELIALDNTKGKFKSAAEALNYGGKQAKGKYIIFVHQDIELDSDMWLEKTEKILDSIPDLGIAGVVGMSEEGNDNKERGRGCISDCGEIWRWSQPVKNPEAVQTLDECLLIIPKAVFSSIQFDEKTFDSWHCYGADYCLSVRQMELKAYVIPVFVYHRSLRTNIEMLVKYKKRLYKKHKKKHKYIYTTTGSISFPKLMFLSIWASLKPIYKKFFPSWEDYLKRELAGCETVLDLGCGYNSAIQYCKVPFSVGVELFEPYLQESQKKSIHSEYIKEDITKIEFAPKSFDIVVCFEVLEHLTKDQGYKLCEKMEKWAKNKIVIKTPNNYIEQDGYDDNPLQEHKSGWDVEELQKLGFEVYGISGWKKLRGYRGEIQYKPVLLWKCISSLTQKITYRCPKSAFQLFAIKRIIDKTSN